MTPNNEFSFNKSKIFTFISPRQYLLMSKEGIVYILMRMAVNTYANVILERFLHVNEG